jgi:hypothetical protein
MACTLAKMKATMFLAAWLVSLAPTGYAQGVFLFDNRTAPTRIGSIAGPLAGTNILAQMLVGLSPAALAPVGVAVAHSGAMGFEGVAFGGNLQVANVPACEFAYVEMVAWDGTLWGQSLAAVPSTQLGMTDTVRVFFAQPANQPEVCGPVQRPLFTQPAVVPIPEPSASVIAVMVGVGTILFCGVRRRLGRRSGA